ncbi:MAG: single-stranded DNA-binding protein [Acidobacteria bacterium]|nr:single-stranded DNA-binding protein [Acidobacteriota bacterium]MBI3424936.1 single-stranded DNA-binding protein [Acidobacteriota bacterium]
MSFNKITIVGYLGRDPELKHTPQGNAVCKFSVATTERRKNAQGEPEETTTWFRVTVWGRQAELANEYLSKGRQVYVEGRLRLEEYVDREGHTRISPEVTALDLQFLGQRNDVVETNNVTVSASTTTTQGIPNESPAEKKQAIAKALGATATKLSTTPSRGKKAAPAAKELVSIEEDDIPF